MALAAGALLLAPERAAADGLGDYDLVGFESGICFGQPDAGLRRLIAALPRFLTRFPWESSTIFPAGVPLPNRPQS